MRWILFFAVVMMAWIINTAYAESFYANVRDFGAKGDGVTNDSKAFCKAFASGRKDVYIPAGTYLLGPESMTIPAQVSVHGDGEASVLKAAKDTGVLLVLSKGDRLSRFLIDGTGVKTGGVPDGVIKLPNGADRVTIEALSFRGCDRACIVTDNANDFLIRDCDFRDVGMAISLQFSNRVKILNNSVGNCRLHGIQFWGCWKWESRRSEDITITGNYVKDGGGGAIWGAGAKRVVASNNIVDGAKDVGIDLEWCQDSVISGNTVRNFENGGISLFFACERVAITGNTVINDRPIADPNAKWWARAGIWLTYPNRKDYKDDHGHRDVTITGNVIYCEPGERRAMWIGSESDNIVIANNAINGGEIWSGGGEGEMKTVKDGVVIKNN